MLKQFEDLSRTVRNLNSVTDLLKSQGDTDNVFDVEDNFRGTSLRSIKMQLSSLARVSLWLLISTVVAPAFTGTPSSAQPAIAQPEFQPASMLISQQNEEDSTPKPRRSYIGAGATIGLSDPNETGLGEGGFSIISRAGFTENLGLHSAAIFADEFTSTLALTVRLPVRSGQSGRTLVEPFIGPGIIIQDGEIDALVSTGADVPLTRDMTATVRLNIGFPNGDTEAGMIFGLGYNFW